MPRPAKKRQRLVDGTPSPVREEEEETILNITPCLKHTDMATGITVHVEGGLHFVHQGQRYVALPHGAQYTVKVEDPRPKWTESVVSLEIDGRELNQELTLTKSATFNGPINEAGQFHFYSKAAVAQAEEEEAQQLPENKRVRPAPIGTGILERDDSGRVVVTVRPCTFQEISINCDDQLIKARVASSYTSHDIAKKFVLPESLSDRFTKEDFYGLALTYKHKGKQLRLKGTLFKTYAPWWELVYSVKCPGGMRPATAIVTRTADGSYSRPSDVIGELMGAIQDGNSDAPPPSFSFGSKKKSVGPRAPTGRSVGGFGGGGGFGSDGSRGGFGGFGGFGAGLESGRLAPPSSSAPTPDFVVGGGPISISSGGSAVQGKKVNDRYRSCYTTPLDETVEPIVFDIKFVVLNDAFQHVINLEDVNDWM